MSRLLQIVSVLLLALMPAAAPRPQQGLAATTGDGQSRESPFTAGETGQVGDYALRVIDVTPDATDVVMAESSFNDAPESGNVFLMVRVEVTYVGRDTGRADRDLEFNIVGSGNRGYSELTAKCGGPIGLIPDGNWKTPELFPQGATEFNVCWEVPEEEAGSFVMYVEPRSGKDRIWFALPGNTQVLPDIGEETTSESGARIVSLDAIDIDFDQKELTASPGDTIVMTNEGVLEHDFAIDAWGGVLIGPLGSGESGEFTVPADARPGDTFDFYCTIPGHKEAGMVGTLTIAGTSSDDDAAEAPGANEETVDLTAIDIAYDQSEITVAPGDTIRLVNDGLLVHDFAVDEWGGVVIGPLDPGESGTFTIPADARPGEYDFYCSIPGHRPSGMEGTLIVSGDPAGQPATGEESIATESDGIITIDAIDIDFDPKEITAAPGDTIRLMNKGVLEHDFAVKAWGGVLIGPLKNGETGEFTIPADAEPGDVFDFYCTIPGHKEAGMTGTLTIVEAGDGVSAEGEEPVMVEENAAPEATSGEPGAASVTIAGVDIAFEPDEITIAPGGTITMTNEGALEHDFAVKEWGGVLIGPLGHGESGEFTIPADVKPGETFEFYCTIPAHKTAGMVGTLTIAEPAPEATPAPDASPFASPIPAFTPAATPAASPVATIVTPVTTSATPVASPMASPIASPVTQASAIPAGHNVLADATVLTGAGVERYIWDDDTAEMTGTGLTPRSLTVGDDDGSVALFAEFVNSSSQPMIAPILQFEARYEGHGFGAQNVHSTQYLVQPGESVFFDGHNLYRGAILYEDWTDFTISFQAGYDDDDRYIVTDLRLEPGEGRIYNDGDEDIGNVSLAGIGRDASGAYAGQCGRESIQATIPAGLFVRIPASVAATPAPGVESCRGTGASFAERLDTAPVGLDTWIVFVPKP